jgi:uncharacterized protein (DUF2236 family)
MAEIRDETGAAPSVSRLMTQLEMELAGAEDPGYFGPSSAMWLVNRELFLSLGLGRALLLQISHPWVAHAVVDHSNVESNPIDRLLATGVAAELLIFGSRSQADAAAARIRKVHARVRGVLREDVGRWKQGTPYRADDPEALLWVLVTLLDTALVTYDACFGGLARSTERRYLREGAQLGAMLGVPPEIVPRDRNDLTRYMRRMIEEGTVKVGSVALRLARQLEELKDTAHTDPMWQLYSSSTSAAAVALLPEELRNQYGLALDRRQRRLYRMLGMLGRMVIPRLPATIRVDPITRRAIERTLSASPSGG